MKEKELLICIDCGFRSEYGRLDEPDPEHEARYRKALDEEGAKPEVLIMSYDDDNIINFSKTPCQFCKTPLWGSRFKAVFHKIGAK